MKICIINSILIYSFFICSLELAAQSKSDQLFEIDKYKNLKVKSASLFEYRYTIEGKRENDGFLIQQIDYDETGRITEIKRYNNNELYNTTKYIYDENNILIRDYFEYVDGVKFKTIHHYDNRGYLIKSDQYDESSFIVLTIEYFYNSLGKTQKEVHSLYNEEFYYEYKYDSNGNIIEKISSPWGGKNQEKTIYNYNENGLIIDSNTFDILGDQIKSVTYNYQFYKN